jgi:hypothetical protein
MGFLKFFAKSSAGVQRLPAGSLTVDRTGNMVTATVSSAYPPQLLRDVSTEVLRIFREAKNAQMPLAEFNLHFASLQITARELRGGAIIFFTPKNLSATR